MVDFSRFQGPSEEWEAYVKNNHLPPVDLTSSPQTIRKLTNALRVNISQTELDFDELREKVSWRDYSLLTRDKQSIIIRVYRPSHISNAEQLPVYLYFHGGGHLLGTVETEDAACSRLASHAGIVVTSANYRHTPEFKHPTQVHDAWDSFEWLAKNARIIGGDPTRVIVGGISAGAGLAASIVIRQHNMVRRNILPRPDLEISGQLICIPWLVHPDNQPIERHPTASFEQNVNAPVLPLSLLRHFTDLLGAQDPKDPDLNVGLTQDSDIVGLPKTSVLVAGQDLLRDEGLNYAEKLSRNSVPTQVHVFSGLPHGFRRFSTLSASMRWDEALVESCRWILSADEASSFTVI